jgi:hypothetical protein
LDLETQPVKKRPPTRSKPIEELIGYEEAASEDEDDIWNYTLKKDNLKPQKNITKEYICPANPIEQPKE